MLRHIRRRFGMSAPRVTVQAHIPWYWRAVVTVLLLVVALVLAGWVYGIGRHYFAGYGKGGAEQELSGLHNRIETLEAELERLRGGNNGSEASLQIDSTVQQKLGEQVKRLEAENGRLREELAVFESLVSGEAKNENVRISRMQVEADTAVAGTYRYRLLLTAPASRSDREFKGRIQLLATFQQDGKPVTANIDVEQPEARKFQLDFKYFQRVEGQFALPPAVVLKRLEARLMQDSTVVATQQVTM